MAEDTPTTETVLQDSGTDDPAEWIRLGIQAARQKEYEKGLIFLAEAYRRLSRGSESKIPAAALSYYGLCLAMHKGRVKEAAEFCQLALEKEFYNAEHYLNLGHVWIVGRSRRKAVDALDRGLAVDPNHGEMQRLRTEMGIRKRPVIPFLGRDNPLNVSLGKMRVAKKSAGGKPGATAKK